MRIIIFILAFAPIILLSQSVGINTDGSTPDSSALLDVKSTTQGMLVPRMTSTQRDLIATPGTGLLIFDTTLGAFHFYDGSVWQNLSKGAVLSDTDEDTKIEVEQNPDEDIVRITVDGNEIVQIHSDRIDMNSYDDNTIIGEDAAENISGANLSTIIGARAGRNFTGDYGVFIGVDAYKETQGQYNTAIGYQSAANDSFGYQNTFLGAEAGKNNKGYQSVIIGKGAGIDNDALQAVSIGYNAGALNKGTGNIFIGANAGIISTGISNLFVGRNAGLQNSTGGGNTYIGDDAGRDGNGYSNVHLGSGSGSKSIGFDNVIIGSQTATNSTNGYKSVVIGKDAALWDTLSTSNVIIGSEAGSGGPNSNFKHMKKENVLIGERAGYSIQGNSNTAVGYRAGRNATGSSNVFLGREAGAMETGNNKLYISNSATNSPLIYGEFDNGLVKINDRLEVDNPNQSSGTAITGISLYPGPAPFGEPSNFGGRFSNAGVEGGGVYGKAINIVGSGRGGSFLSNSANGAGVYGSSPNNGGEFISNGENGSGVFGTASHPWGENKGGFFSSSSTSGTGVYGHASTLSGSTYGGYFSSHSTTGIGALGIATNTNGVNYGGYFSSLSETGRGVYGEGSATTGNNYGGYFISKSQTGIGVYGIADNSGPTTNIGGYFKAGGSTGIGTLVESTGSNGTAILASGTGSSSTGLYAQGVYRAAVFQGEVETNGHLHIDAPIDDAKIYMKSISGIEGRVLQRQNTTENVYMGDIDSRGGDVFIRADGDEKIRVQQDGGITLGEFGISSSALPNSIRVKNLEIAGDGPLRADGSGNIYKDQTVYYASFGPSGFYINASNPVFGLASVLHLEYDNAIQAINLPDKAHLQDITMHFTDTGSSEIHLYLMKVIGGGSSTVASVFSVGALGSSSKTESFSHVVDNSTYTYYLKAVLTGPDGGDQLLKNVSIGYTLSAQ